MRKLGYFAILCGGLSLGLLAAACDDSTTGGTAPGSCTDKVKNDKETDVDCGGGACPVCSDGLACLSPTDCVSKVCSSGRCQAPACTDSVMNGAEVDVDCGGGACGKCGDGKKCSKPEDCMSGVCTGGTCQAPSCSDMIMNGPETDVDCGGSCPSKCPLGKACTKPEDCMSGVCNGGKCVPITCTDGTKNGQESDVDCGGAECSKCANGQQCKTSGDCQSAVCAGGVCQAPSCDDRVTNGQETDVDCGGGVCKKCGDGKMCIGGEDCEGGVCAAGVCQTPTCTDSAMNGKETDVDCGGPDCKKCGDTKKCKAPTDCESNVCDAGICVKAACTDGVMNGGESDIDCGGPSCSKCGDGKKCKEGNDCASLVCTGGVCKTASCTDGVANGKETDIDCGGADCKKCGDNSKCKDNADCSSGVCTNGVCQAPTCTDKVKNGLETDTDCGGGKCPLCVEGKVCAMNGDCATNLCIAGMCTYVQHYSNPGDCKVTQRDCQNVVPDPKDPNVVTLGESTNQLQPFIYISVTSRNQVAQLNTETGVKNWQVDSYGMNPSRTVVALDGSLWVGNRCLSGDPNNPACSSAVHFDTKGGFICRADVTGIVRGMAIDAEGNVWAGTYNGQSVWKISGTEIDKTVTPYRCKVMKVISVGHPVYGLAIDGRGYLWTGMNTGGNTVKVDTRTGSEAIVARVAHDSGYGIAIDTKNRVWFGNNPFQRIDGDPPYNSLRVTSMSGVYAVTVHPDGTIWGASHDGSPRGVFKITLTADGNGVASKQGFTDPENAQNHGVAVDKAGKIWSPQRFTGYVNRWSTSGTREARFPVDPGQELYSYSDMTGIQLRTITAREGHWIQYFDSGKDKPIWDHMEWDSAVPAGTGLEVKARSADTETDFANGKATAWCGPFTKSPASFAACAFLNDHRWIQLDVKLSTTTDGIKPTVSDVKVFWAHK